MLSQELNRGLLLGLAELRRTFLAYGESFHTAYREALQAHSDPVTIQALEDFDPVFGVYHEAERMLLEGMCSFIIALSSPLNQRAFFTISAMQATRELDELPGHYRKMAVRFHEALD